MIAEIIETAALEIERAHRLNEIAQRVDASECLRPFWHARNGGNQTAQENEDDEEEKHHEGCLLRGVGIVGHDESHARNHEDEEGGKEEDDRDVAHWLLSVDEESQHHRIAQYQQAHYPVRYQLGEDEVKLAHRGYVDLFDGSLLLLAHDVEGREESYEQYQEHRHQAWYHEELII